MGWFLVVVATIIGDDAFEHGIGIIIAGTVEFGCRGWEFAASWLALAYDPLDVNGRVRP